MGLASWYDRTIMPRLVTMACSQGQIMKLRSGLLDRAEGKLLEMGCGGGLNQQFYDQQRVTEFAGIDPHEKLLEGARDAAKKKGWATDIRQGIGEDIPFESERFDTVVCTYTLCSVQEPARVLSEIRRVLRPGGTLLFLEHGQAPDPNVRKWQARVEPIWKKLAGGCHLTRPVGESVAGSGLKMEPLGETYLPKTPRVLGWMEWGLAHKPS